MTRRHSAISRAAALLGSVLATLACSPISGDGGGPSETGFPLAYFHDDCAPWDGPALTLTLSHTELSDPFEATYPLLRVTSYRPPSPLAGGSFAWSGTAQSEGYATLCESQQACETAESVEVRFDRRQEGEDRLAGALELLLDDGRRVAGRFLARRLPFTALCG